MLVSDSNCCRSTRWQSLFPLEHRRLLVPLPSDWPLVASWYYTASIVCGDTGRSMGNHIIFLHQFGTIGESDRQFVIL
jgi:hypothetical protein